MRLTTKRIYKDWLGANLFFVNHFSTTLSNAKHSRILLTLVAAKIKTLVYHQPKIMRYHLIVSLLLTLLAVGGCQPVEEKITKDEAVKFASDLEASATKRKEGFLSSSIIFNSMMNRLDQAKKIKDWDAAENSLRLSLKRNELDKSLFQVMGQNGTFENIKIYEKNGIQRAVFRGYGEGGFNYLDMELVKYDGKIGIADIYIYLTGENLSTTMAVLLDKLMNVAPSSDEYLAQRMTSVRSLIKQNNYTEARTQFNYLPASVKTTTAGITLNLQILSKLQDTASAQELALLEKRYGDQSYFQFQMLDVYNVKKQYDKALQVINQLDSVVDKDPFLNYYRGLYSYLKGDEATAISYYEKVTETNPGFPGAYAELFALHAYKDDKPTAQKYFSAYRKLRNKDLELVKKFIAAYPYLDEKNTQLH